MVEVKQQVVPPTNDFISTKITLTQGILIGGTLKSRSGREFVAFQGIPYAKPPINELRFQDPVPAESWEGEFNATSEPERCLQKNVINHGMSDVLIGKEDCLYLNVYTPKMTKEIKNLMPVMFWIPGKGFVYGHGGLSSFGPHYLLDKDVVVVSINYRVGILGFLSTQDDTLPGNYGLKDQVLALKWVKNNIEKFGGDPNKVTIFGESAGAASVGLHLLSPMSKGLFHKAIMESASPLDPWVVSPPKIAKTRAEGLSTQLLDTVDLKLLVDSFRKLPAKVLVDPDHNYFKTWIPSVWFQPVVENCENSDQSFLCKHPLEDFTLESNVPVLLGMSSGEGGIFAAQMYDPNGYFHRGLETVFDYYVTHSIGYGLFPTESVMKSIGAKTRDLYFPGGNMDQPLQAVKMVNDMFFIRGINDMAFKMPSKVHYYVYEHVNESSPTFHSGSYPKNIDAIYSDEMISLFFINGVPALQGKDLEISKRMVNMWTQFAYTDKLTIDGTTDGIEWPLFDTEDMKYVLIQTDQTIISEKPYMDNYNFWTELKESLKSSQV